MQNVCTAVIHRVGLFTTEEIGEIEEVVGNIHSHSGNTLIITRMISSKDAEEIFDRLNNFNIIIQYGHIAVLTSVPEHA